MDFRISAWRRGLDRYGAQPKSLVPLEDCGYAKVHQVTAIRSDFHKDVVVNGKYPIGAFAPGDRSLTGARSWSRSVPAALTVPKQPGAPKRETTVSPG